MRLSRLLPTAAIAGVASAMIVVGSVSVPAAQAQTRLTVPGAGPLYYPNVITDLPLGRFYLLGTGREGGEPLSLVEGYNLLNPMIGENWFPGSQAQVVHYPASVGVLSGSLAAPGADAAVEMGRESLDQQIKDAAANGHPVVIAGLSEGTIVINRELAHLATDPNAPPAGSLSFVLFSSPELGLADTYLPAGTTVPLINYTVADLADSRYDVNVVFHQYEGWGNPPDRPWNLLAVVNSLFGTLYFHNSTAMAAPSDAVVVSSVTSDPKGTTTTYMIPSPTVPLLEPLQQLGVPTRIVDALNSRIKPIVDAGYSTLTPDGGPYFSHGQLLGLPARSGSPTDIPISLSAPKSARGAVDSPPARQAVARRRTVEHLSEAVKTRIADATGSAANNQDSHRFAKRGPRVALHFADRKRGSREELTAAESLPVGSTERVRKSPRRPAPETVRPGIPSSRRAT